MRRILICSGVLGGGTALVFGAAALTTVLIPPGRIVPQGQQMIFERGGAVEFGGPVVVDIGTVEDIGTMGRGDLLFPRDPGGPQ